MDVSFQRKAHVSDVRAVLNSGLMAAESTLAWDTFPVNDTKGKVFSLFFVCVFLHLTQEFYFHMMFIIMAVDKQLNFLSSHVISSKSLVLLFTFEVDSSCHVKVFYVFRIEQIPSNNQ